MTPNCKKIWVIWGALRREIYASFFYGANCVNN